MYRGIAVILLAALVVIQAPVGFMQTQEEVDESVYEVLEPRDPAAVREQRGRVTTGLREEMSFEEAGLKKRVEDASSRMGLFLRSLISSVQRTQGLSEEAKEELTSDLNKDVGVLQSEAARTTIAGTGEELRENIDRIRQFWTSRISDLRKKVGRLLIARVEHAKDRFIRLDVKIDLLKERLQANDIATDEIELLQTQLRGEIEETDSLIAEATDIFASITSENENSNNLELFQSGVQKLREAHEQLRLSRDTFKELLAAVRTAIPQLPDSDFSSTTPPSNTN